MKDISPEVHKPEAVDGAVYVVTSHPAKMLAVLALAESPGEEKTAYGIIDRLKTAAGAVARPVPHSVSTFGAFCSQSLAARGYLIESTRLSVPMSGRTPGRATVFSIATRGMEALAPIGAVARWEGEHDQASARDLLGSVRVDRRAGALMGGTATRLAVLSKLAAQPGGFPTTLLEKTCGKAAGFHLRQLSNLNILQLLSKSKPEHRRLRVITPDIKNMGPFMGVTSPEVRALYIAATRLSKAGKTELSGAELLQEVERSSHQNPAAVWRALVKHQPACLEFVDAEIFGGKAHRNSYRVAPRYRQAVTDFTTAITSLREDPDFWGTSYHYATHLLEDGAQVAYLLAKAFRKSCSGQDDHIPSERIVLEAIPEHGITERDLLASVVLRRRMSLATLRNHLAKSVNTVVERAVRMPNRVRPIHWVSKWAGEFPSDWRGRAACAKKDSEMFFPIGVTGLSAAQVEQAKQVCRSCPVRPACLKTAVENSEPDGIWGGFTEEERRSLPAEVQIGLRHVSVNS